MKKVLSMLAVLSLLGLASCHHMGARGGCSDKGMQCSAGKSCGDCNGPKAEGGKDAGSCPDCKK